METLQMKFQFSEQGSAALRARVAFQIVICWHRLQAETAMRNLGNGLALKEKQKTENKQERTIHISRL